MSRRVCHRRRNAAHDETLGVRILAVLRTSTVLRSIRYRFAPKFFPRAAGTVRTVPVPYRAGKYTRLT